MEKWVLQTIARWHGPTIPQQQDGGSDTLLVHVALAVGALLAVFNLFMVVLLQCLQCCSSVVRRALCDAVLEGGFTIVVVLLRRHRSKAIVWSTRFGILLTYPMYGMYLLPMLAQQQQWITYMASTYQTLIGTMMAGLLLLQNRAEAWVWTGAFVAWMTAQLYRLGHSTEAILANAVTACCVLGLSGVVVIMLQASFNQLRQYAAATAKARDSAERLSRAKAHFIAAISHEVRTPLNGLMGLLDSLAETAPLSTAQSHLISEIQRCAHVLMFLSMRALHFTRYVRYDPRRSAPSAPPSPASDSAGSAIASGPDGAATTGSPATRLPFSLRALLEDAVQTVAAAAHVRGVVLHCSVASSVPDAVHGAPGPLLELLLKMLDYGLGRVPDGTGRVLLRLQGVSAPLASLPLCITLRDNGPPLSAQQRAVGIQPLAAAEGPDTQRLLATGADFELATAAIVAQWLDGTLQFAPVATDAASAADGAMAESDLQPVLLARIRLEAAAAASPDATAIEGGGSVWSPVAPRKQPVSPPPPLSLSPQPQQQQQQQYQQQEQPTPLTPSQGGQRSFLQDLWLRRHNSGSSASIGSGTSERASSPEADPFPAAAPAPPDFSVGSVPTQRALRGVRMALLCDYAEAAATLADTLTFAGAVVVQRCAVSPRAQTADALRERTMALLAEHGLALTRVDVLLVRLHVRTVLTLLPSLLQLLRHRAHQECADGRRPAALLLLVPPALVSPLQHHLERMRLQEMAPRSPRVGSPEGGALPMGSHDAPRGSPAACRSGCGADSGRAAGPSAAAPTARTTVQRHPSIAVDFCTGDAAAAVHCVLVSTLLPASALIAVVGEAAQARRTATADVTCSATASSAAAAAAAAATSAVSVACTEAPSLTALPPLPLSSPAAGSSVAPAGTRSVLVVEDNKVNVMVLQRMLRRLGLASDAVPDGAAALQKLGLQDGADATPPPYRLVLMDLHMPVLDGLEATRRLRRWERQQGWPVLPVVAVTASVLSETRTACAEAGMQDFLAKPLSEDRLRRCLQALGVL